MRTLKAGAVYFVIVFGTGFVLGPRCVAPALLLTAELTLVLSLRGFSSPEYVASLDPVSGPVYAASLGTFALMPLLVASARGRRGHR